MNDLEYLKKEIQTQNIFIENILNEMKSVYEELDILKKTSAKLNSEILIFLRGIRNNEQ